MLGALGRCSRLPVVPQGWGQSSTATLSARRPHYSGLCTEARMRWLREGRAALGPHSEADCQSSGCLPNRLHQLGARPHKAKALDVGEAERAVWGAAQLVVALPAGCGQVDPILLSHNDL